MKHIGRIIALAAAAAMMITLTACSGGSSLPDDYAYEDLSKYIKLGEYKGIEYTKADLNVTDEEVKAEVDKALENGAEETKVEEGTVTEDSVVNIDYVGSIDGVEFEGGTAQGQDLDIANSTYIEGFAEGIVGHQVGETFDLNVTFPDDYGKAELAGKPAVFRTTINYMTVKQKPEYTDEWVKANTDSKDIASYEASIKEKLAADKEASALKDEQGEVFNVISDNSEVIEYPEKELKARHDTVVESYEALAKNSGTSLDEYIASSMGMDKDSFNKAVNEAAENTVKTELILHAIAREEGIEFTDKDYKDYLNGILEEAGYTEESFKKERGEDFSKYAEENNLYMPYMYERVMTKVMEYSKAK